MTLSAKSGLTFFREWRLAQKNNFLILNARGVSQIRS